MLLVWACSACLAKNFGFMDEAEISTHELHQQHASKQTAGGEEFLTGQTLEIGSRDMVESQNTRSHSHYSYKYYQYRLKRWRMSGIVIIVGIIKQVRCCAVAPCMDAT